LVIYTAAGRQHLLKVLDLPYGKFRNKGVPVDNVCTYVTSEETAVGVYALSDVVKNYLLFTTKAGMMKVTEGAEFDVTRRNIAATKLNDGDELVSVIMVRGDEDYIILESETGFFLKFAFNEIPEKKKGAVGVIGMKLAAADSVASVYVTSEMSKANANSAENSAPDSNPEMSLLDMMSFDDDYDGGFAISGGSDDVAVDANAAPVSDVEPADANADTAEESEPVSEEQYIVTAKSGANVDLRELRVNKRGGKGSRK
jgi:DNA gyrase subunit A